MSSRRVTLSNTLEFPHPVLLSNSSAQPREEDARNVTQTHHPDPSHPKTNSSSDPEQQHRNKFLSQPAHSLMLWDSNQPEALSFFRRRTEFSSPGSDASGHVFCVHWTPFRRTEALRATLAWTDPPAALMAETMAVNDLDLLISDLSTLQQSASKFRIFSTRRNAHHDRGGWMLDLVH